MDLVLRSTYAKALVPLIAGAALVALGLVLGDETLRAFGYGAIGSSPIVAAVPNGAAVHIHDGDPPEDDTTTLDTNVHELSKIAGD